MTLAALIDQLRAAAGLRHKADIAPVLERLNITGHEAIAIGDDCAAIPDGDGYLLFAIEGFVPGFVQAEPHFAGYCGVMVNLSDIAAMGGRPIAVVDAIWARDAEEAAPVLAGLADAAQRYGVPIVGGHTNTRAPAGMLSVAVLGRARKLLTSFAAQPGQVLLAAIDLRGTMRASGPYWDASTGAAPADLRENLDILAELAEDGLCAAAKDISMAGLAGTAIMFMEASGCGAVIDLNAIPHPPGMPLDTWLQAFPSFGFLLSVEPGALSLVQRKFSRRGIACGVIGSVNNSRKLQLSLDGERMTLWDVSEDRLIGCGGQTIDA